MWARTLFVGVPSLSRLYVFTQRFVVHEKKLAYSLNGRGDVADLSSGNLQREREREKSNNEVTLNATVKNGHEITKSEFGIQ